MFLRVLELAAQWVCIVPFRMETDRQTDNERDTQRERQGEPRERDRATETYLPEGVKLLPLRDGELPSLVPVNSIVQHLPFVQQAQRIGAAVVSGPDPGRESTSSLLLL